MVNGSLTNIEPVDNVSPTVTPFSGTSDTFTYTFADQLIHDSQDAEYTYYIEEGSWVDGTWVKAAPTYYTADNVDDLEITNTFSNRQIDITVNKTWAGVSGETPEIWFKLFTQVGDGAVAEAEAEVLKLAPNTPSVAWSGLNELTSEGEPIQYIIREGIYNDTQVPPVFTEETLPGFTKSDPACTKDNETGNISCAITNTRLAALTIKLDSSPDSNMIFNYLLTYPDSSSEKFDLDDNGTEDVPAELNSSKAFDVLPPGTYQIKQENLSTDWVLENIQCEVADMPAPEIITPMALASDQ